jgi:hypothetical protein
MGFFSKDPELTVILIILLVLAAILVAVFH